MSERDIAAEAAAIWERKAAHWAEFMGPEGNRLFREVIAPAQLRLLELERNDRVLEVACGAGQFSRLIAPLVKSVLACDVSPTFIERARDGAATAGLSNVDCRVVDATDETALRALRGPFDAAVCAMALMDLPVIEPLLNSVHDLLGPNGRFVFTVMHPAFFSTRASLVAEERDAGGVGFVDRWIKVTAYLNVPVEKGVGVGGEPEPHYYFHRPIGRLLTACFDAGFVLDGIEEPTFTSESDGSRLFDWRDARQFPPVLVCRLRAESRA